MIYPWSHILSERISLIRYFDIILDGGEGTFIHGQCHLSVKDGEPDIIYIYKQPQDYEEEDGRTRMYHTIFHEIGHSVFNRIRNKTRRDWGRLVEPDKPERSILPSEPILTEDEEFAECYSHYIQEPDSLKLANMNKYQFLRLHIFGNREYPQYFKEG